MKKNFPAWLTLAAALALIVLGIVQKQPAQVLAKAIRVCMECVGIG
ncbi:MAG: CD1871A family CXXC motif-containing protein [Candidatus Faecousia sp.]|nr:CD1871A family CXXC motif-containing protein [Bacillota bacterium]MDY4490470.1 CD1871A family CXXC motif-containing protein [Candidatus Faecousia sp.]MDY6160335.1 CD1871A family CXXC motif-containing protein [Candidatus Faecousia sp.]